MIHICLSGDYATLVSRRPSVDLSQGKSKSSDKEKAEESDIQAGKLSVFIHKREDQLSHEVIQPLLGYTLLWITSHIIKTLYDMYLFLY